MGVPVVGGFGLSEKLLYSELHAEFPSHGSIIVSDLDGKSAIED